MTTPAADFVAARQAEAPPHSWSSPAEKILGREGCDSRRADYSTLLLNWLGERIPPYISQGLESGEIAIGELGINKPDAKCKMVAPGQFAVLIHSGLSHFVYRTVRLICSGIEVEVASKDNRLDWNIVFPLSLDDKIVYALRDLFFWFNATDGEVYGPAHEVTIGQAMFANFVTWEASSFFLGHEFGHIMCAEAADRPGSSIEEEYMADRLGLNIVLGALAKPPVVTDHIHLTLCGVEVAIAIFRGLERLGVSFSEEEHPAATQRYDRIRANAQILLDGLPEIFVFVDQFRDLLDSAVARMDSSAYSSAYEKDAAAFLRAFGVLLRECSGGPVPDYTRFRDEALHLFSQSYSYEIWKMISEQTAIMFRGMVSLPPTSDILDKVWSGRLDEYERLSILDVRTDYQKWKLLYSIVSDLPDTPRSLLLEALY